MTTKEALAKILESDSFEIHKIWENLVSANVIAQNGRLARIPYGQTSALIENACHGLPINLQSRLINHLKSIRPKQPFFRIPKYLESFFLSHLDHFIESAKVAKLKMKPNVDYVIGLPKGKEDSPQIIIQDRSTGTDLISTQYSNGLQQFLQLKHGCRLTPLSLKAVFISNVTFFKKYDHMLGLSGTLGSDQEEDLLRRLYKAKMIRIPTDRPKNFYEERPVIATNQESWRESIFNEIFKKIKERRSVLVVMDSIHQVSEMEGYIRKSAKKVKTLMISEEDEEIAKILEDPQNILTYTRDYKPFSYGNSFEPQKVIIATNLAGRGTDIRLHEDLIKNGGLHVLLTFCPLNIRIEEQAFGRAGRAGEPGSARMVILDRNAAEDELKKKRDFEEKTRLKVREKRLSAQSYKQYTIPHSTPNIFSGYRQQILENNKTR